MSANQVCMLTQYHGIRKTAEWETRVMRDKICQVTSVLDETLP